MPAPPAPGPAPSPFALGQLVLPFRVPCTPISASAPLPLGSLGAQVSTLCGAEFPALLASAPSIPARGSRPPPSPTPSATPSFRQARPSCVQDRLPDQLEEGPESGVTRCTRPVIPPKATPRILFWARVAA